MSDILNINSVVRSDESITGIQYHSYSPYTTSFNHNDEIRIVLQQQDLYTLPSESYIYIEGQTARTDAGGANALALPALVDFAAAHLFSDIRYEINGFEVDRCKNAGITGLMKGYPSLSPSNVGSLTTSSFLASAVNVAVPGSFEYRVPLKMLLGFAEDYKKIVMHAKQELILVRSRNDTNCFVGVNNNARITITKIQWKIPQVHVSDHSKLMLLKTVERKQPIPLAFRSWDLYEYPALPLTDKHTWSIKTSNNLNKPRYVIVGFQTGRDHVIAQNASKFDHCQITDLKVHLNSESFPYENMNLNFESNLYMQAFINFAMFKKSYYHNDSDQQHSLTNYNDFKTNVPLFIIDCSRQNEAIKSSMVDIRLEITARQNFAANTTAFCLIIHDNIITYNPYTSIVARAV